MAPKRYEEHNDDSDISSDGDSFNGGKSNKRIKYEKGTVEYQKRRERNNIAVKKSREKSRMKAKETTEQVKRLTSENEMLVQKVQILSKELSVLKDLFLAHAGNVTSSCDQLSILSQSKTEVQTVDHEYSKTLKFESK